MLLLACASPTWTDDRAVAGLARRADLDADGTVTAAELPGADGDRDGVVSTGELLAWLDGPGLAWKPPRWTPPPTRSVGVAPRGDPWLLLEHLRQEVVALDPAAPVPTAAELAATSGLDTFDDPQLGALCARLLPEARRLGVPVPRVLEAAGSASTSGP